jgi:DNA-binding response OmpR family regulator
LVLHNPLSASTEAYFDDDKLSKIITNLLSNALKFTPKGGEVRVNVAPLDPHEPVLKFHIQDTGIGIAPEQLTSIFDRFYQIDSSVRRSYDGSGIGLALVKELVEVLGGEIRAESQVNQGTTFYLQVPVGGQSWAGVSIEAALPLVAERDWPIREQTPPPLPEATPAGGAPPSKPLLLIVEDNPDLRSYIANLFANEHQVVEAANGQDGLQKALESPPDLLITDWMMPVMDGLTMCQRLKADVRSSHVPVIMLTAKSAVESRLEGFEGGADDYVVKPFHAHELRLKVRNWLQRQAQLRQHYHQLLSEPHETPPVPPVEAAFMERIFQTIDQHLNDAAFGVEHLAEQLQINRRTLQRKVQTLTALSPNELIRNHRLRRALPLLKQGQPIADVAFKVGFENPSYFSKCFREAFGKLPSELIEN